MKLGSVSVGPLKLGAAGVAVLIVATVWPLAAWVGAEVVLVPVTAVAVAGLGLALLTRRTAARRVRVLEQRLAAADARGDALRDRVDALVERVEQQARAAERDLASTRRELEEQVALSVDDQRRREDQRNGRVEQRLRGLDRATNERLRAAQEELREEQWTATADLRDTVTRVGVRHGGLDDLRTAVTAELAGLRASADRAGARAPGADAGPPPVGGAEDATPAGRVERLRTSGLFDEAWYRAGRGEELPAGADPVVDYLERGWREGASPSPLVDLADLSERLLAGDREPIGLFLDRRAADELPARTDPPVPLRADDPDGDLELRWRHLLDGGYRHDDTFALVRVVGNDLPPRHRPGQALENLRFVLDHEPDLPGCERHWILNRITDPEVEDALVACLEEHGATFTRLPFRWEEYRRVGWRYGDFPEPGFVHGPRSRAHSERGQAWLLDHVYHDKNRYVMNNNGARNAALEYGRTRARWVLPWDGNGFVTAAAWEALVTSIRERPHLPYVLVPMARVTENPDVLDPSFAPDAREEPQVVFRADARETFDPDRRYGRRPKVELLQRLGVPGPWERWRIDPWEPPARRSPDEGRYHRASYVVRLSSGQPALEVDIDERGWQRTRAIQDRIDDLDRRAASSTFHPDTAVLATLAVEVGAAPISATASAASPAPTSEPPSAPSSVEGSTEVVDGGPPAPDPGDPAGPGDPSDPGTAPFPAADVGGLVALAHEARTSGDAARLDVVADRLDTLLAAVDASGVDRVPPAPWTCAVLDVARSVRAGGRTTATSTSVLDALAERARDAAQRVGPSGAIWFEDEPTTVWAFLDEIAARSHLGDLPGVLATARRAVEIRDLRARAIAAIDTPLDADAGASPVEVHEPTAWITLLDAIERLTGVEVDGRGRVGGAAADDVVAAELGALRAVLRDAEVGAGGTPHPGDDRVAS